jgi:hypothetical protein
MKFLLLNTNDQQAIKKAADIASRKPILVRTRGLNHLLVNLLVARSPTGVEVYDLFSCDGAVVMSPAPDTCKPCKSSSRMLPKELNFYEQYRNYYKAGIEIVKGISIFR